MINEILKTLLSLSVSGALLLFIVFLLKQLYKRRLSRCFQYYIWLVVAFRFLLPLSPDNAVTNLIFTAADSASSSGIAAFGNAAVDGPSGKAPADAGKQAGGTGHMAEENDAPGYRPGLSFILFYIWAAAALAFAVRKVTVYQSFIRYTRAGNTEVTDIEALNLLADCEERLHIRKAAELYRNPFISSPIMTGILRPAIILPAGQPEKEKLSCIFTHELIHYKRHDMLYKWFIQLVICVHWFNPFIYLLGREVNKACELSCDEAVIRPLDDKARRAYGDILLSFVKADNTTYRNSLSSVTLTEGAEQLKERLGAIMNYKKSSKILRAATAILTVMIFICFHSLGAYAKQDGSQDYTAGNSSVKNEERFTYVQRGYYQDSFIVEMGWNYDEKSFQPYSAKARIVLKDRSEMTVYFAEEAKEYAGHKKLLSAAGNLVSFFISERRDGYPEIEAPYILGVTPVPEEDVAAMADMYFEEGEVLKFSALFPALDTKAREEYFRKAYSQDKIASFSIMMEYMDEASLLLYAEKAEQDGKISFFSILLDYIPEEAMRRYAEKYYENGEIARFSVLLDHMSDEEKQRWLERAQTDRKNTFYAVLEEELTNQDNGYTGKNTHGTGG